MNRTKTHPLRIFRSLAIAALMVVGVATNVRASDFDLNQYRGKVVYLDFWASWCGPCRESFPWMSDLVREYSSKQLIVIGVNVDQDRMRAERFLNETPANFAILYDPRGDLATTYKVAGMPSAVLIDREGHIRFSHTGFSAKNKELYEEQLRTLLNEAAK